MRHFSRIDLDYRLDLIAAAVVFFSLPFAITTLASIF